MITSSFHWHPWPLKLMACAAIAFAVSGCALKRDTYDVPAVTLPDGFLNQAAVTAAASGKSASGVAAVPADQPQTPLPEVLPQWWRLFKSPELDQLVDRALHRNHDLRMATLRVAQEQARFGQAAADELPTLSAPIQAGVDAPKDGLGSVRKDQPVESDRQFRAGLRADWRVDLWGERAAAAEAARQRLWQATYQKDNTQKTVIADVVAAYLDYLSLNDRYRVAQETEASQSEMLNSVEERYKEGEATGIELQQQNATVRSSRSNLPTLDLQRAETRHRLAVLVGATPGDLKLSDAGLDSITMPAVVPGVPSTLLLRRPDVRVAEAELLLADANIDEARAKVLPPLDLSAGGGVGSNHLSALFAPQSVMWNAVANLTTTIFDYGKRAKQVDYARARHQELVEAYIRAIYTAVRDVEDSLAGIHFNDLRLKAQTDALDSSRTAWEYSKESYRVGASDYQTMLDTERTYRRDLDDLHRVRLLRYQSTVSLFRSLGGGLADQLPLPGDGRRPTAPDAKDSGVVLAAAPAPVKTDGIVWDQTDVPDGWFVTLSALYDRPGLEAAWRNLQGEYGYTLKGITAYPEEMGRIKGKAGDQDQDRMRWYRLRLVGLTDEAKAKATCETLSRDGRPCAVDEE